MNPETAAEFIERLLETPAGQLFTVGTFILIVGLTATIVAIVIFNHRSSTKNADLSLKIVSMSSDIHDTQRDIRDLFDELLKGISSSASQAALTSQQNAATLVKVAHGQTNTNEAIKEVLEILNRNTDDLEKIKHDITLLKEKVGV